MQSPQPPAPAPVTAPWFPPPTYPPPQPPPPRRGNPTATASVVAGILGLVFGLATGIAGLVLGPVAYFLGRSSVRKVDEARGALPGRGAATAGWVLGVIATAIGAIVSLVWLVLLFEAIASSTG